MRRKMRKDDGRIPLLIYDVLTEECGASDDEREWFHYQFTNCDWREWRFRGKLGMGGKFWRNSGRFYVNCYSEDETPDRLTMIAKANERLAVIRASVEDDE